MITANADELWQRVGPVYARIGEQWNSYLDSLTDEQIEFGTALLERASELNAAETDRLRVGTRR